MPQRYGENPREGLSPGQANTGPGGTDLYAQGGAGTQPASPAPPIDGSRRGFLAGGIGLLGAGLAVSVLGPAATMLAYPLGNQTTSGSDEYLAAGAPNNFNADVPVKVDLFADRVDAWNRVIQVKVGSAWVLQRGDQVVAYTTVCPHLGCGIDYDAPRGKFLCACHKSWFGLDGSLEEGPSPRGMDELDVQANEKLVAIRYQRFKQGVEVKEPIV